MDATTNQQIVTDGIADVGADVRATKQETRNTGRDIASLKDDVGYIRDQLSKILKTKAPPATPKRPVYQTKAGKSSLTAVSLNELALRIKFQNPQMSYDDALKAAKPVQKQNIEKNKDKQRQLKELGKAQDTLNTGGGSFVGNLKRGILRSALGENLGTKASRFLTNKKTQEKAAQTILNFNTKAERVQNAEPVVALASQVSKLTEAVKQNTAVKVETPKIEPRAVKEDLSDAVAGLKVLGYDIKEIKERLATLPRGLSTEDKIKHALKSSTDRIAARNAYDETQKALKANASAPAPAEPVSNTQGVGNDAPRAATAVKAIRGSIPADMLAQRKKMDAQGQSLREQEEDNVSWQDKVMKELHRIQDGIKKTHSESFLGLLAAALGALVLPYIGTIYDKIKAFFSGISKASDFITTKILDTVDEIKGMMPSDKTMNKVGGVAEGVGQFFGKAASYLDPDTDQSTRDEMDREFHKSQTKRANKDKLYNQGYKDEEIATLPKSYEEAQRRKLSRWIDENFESHNIIPRAQPKAVTSDTATKMEQHSNENVQLKDNKTSMVIQPIIQPMKETQVAVPTGGGGGSQSLLALLDARNSEQSAGGYMANAFDHPAGYGAISRV